MARDDAGVDNIVAGVGPRVARGRATTGQRARLGCHPHPVIRRYFDRSPVALDKNERLREALPLEVVLGISHFAQHGDITLGIHHYRRHVFAFDIIAHPPVLAIHACGLTEQEPAHVQDVASQIHQDKLVKLTQERLVLEHRVA